MIYSLNYLVVVLIDYMAIKGIVEKSPLTTISIEHNNRRLIYTTIYLSKYNL